MMSIAHGELRTTWKGIMKHWHWLLLVILIASGVLLQVGAAAQKSYWEDEAWTAKIVQADYPKVIETTAADRHPPLYFLLAAGWSRLFGTTELELRSLSILFIVLVYILAFILTRSLYGDRAAWIALTLLVFSPFLLIYGHNARYYTLSAAASLIVALATHKYSLTRRWPYLLVYLLGGVILLYSVYTALAILLACNLWWLVQLRGRKASVSEVLIWVSVQALLVLSYLPWLPRMSATTLKNIGFDPASVNWLVEILQRAAYLGYAFGVGETISPLNPIAWLGVAIIILVGTVGITRKAIDCWFPLFFLIISGVISIFVSIVSIYPVSLWQGVPNRMLYAYPFLVIWLACAMTKMKRRWTFAAVAALLVVYFLAGFNYFTGREYIKPHLLIPWRKIMENIQGGGAVVCGRGDTACRYYVERYGHQAYRPEDWAELVESGHQEIWWIQINLGYTGGNTDKILELVKNPEPYQVMDVYNYAGQDPGIRWLKSSLLGQEDYAYRLILYRFADPVGQ